MLTRWSRTNSNNSNAIDDSHSAQKISSTDIGVVKLTIWNRVEHGQYDFVLDKILMSVPDKILMRIEDDCSMV